MRGLAHAPEVCQFDFERAWLIEHLAQQTGIAGVVLDKKNSDGFFAHHFATVGSLTMASQKLSIVLTTFRNWSRSTGLVM